MSCYDTVHEFSIMQTCTWNSVSIYIPSRLQSRYEPAVRVWEGEGEENITALLASVMETARPLVGIRSKSNIKWYEGLYPLLVAYTEVDLSSKSECCTIILMYRCVYMHQFFNF